MDKKMILKILRYVLLAGMVIFTVLCYFDIKFMVAGLNIIEWDVVIAFIWSFVQLCKWAGRKHTVIRMLAGLAIMSAVFIVMFGRFIFYGGPCYVEKTEPQTRRTFVVEHREYFPDGGRAKLYERFGPLLLPCDVEEWVGDIGWLLDPDERRVYISNDGKEIVVYYFTSPVFYVPLE